MRYRVSQRTHVATNDNRGMHNAHVDVVNSYKRNLTQDGPLASLVGQCLGKGMSSAQIAQAMTLLLTHDYEAAANGFPAFRAAFDAYVADAKKTGATVDEARRITRRHFLKASAAASPFLFAGSALGADVALDPAKEFESKQTMYSGVFLLVGSIVGAVQAREGITQDTRAMLAADRTDVLKEYQPQPMFRALDRKIRTLAEDRGVAFVDTGYLQR